MPIISDEILVPLVLLAAVVLLLYAIRWQNRHSRNERRLNQSLRRYVRRSL